MYDILGLKEGDKMSVFQLGPILKARREELENINLKSNYLQRLTKAKIILPQDNSLAASDCSEEYGVPWL